MLYFRTFNFKTNNLNEPKTRIEEDTILTLDPDSGKVLSSWGKGMFYMPHGLTIDADGNTYVTDVGLHQVMRVGRQNDKSFNFSMKVPLNMFILCLVFFSNIRNYFDSFQLDRRNQISFWELLLNRGMMKNIFVSLLTLLYPKKLVTSLLLTDIAILEYSNSPLTEDLIK